MPDDVVDEAIATGDEIESASRHGKIRVRPEAEPPLRRGIASFSHGLGALPREGAKHADASVSGSWPTSTDDSARESIDAMPRTAGSPISGERTGAPAPGSVEAAEGASPSYRAGQEDLRLHEVKAVSAQAAVAWLLLLLAGGGTRAGSHAAEVGIESEALSSRRAMTGVASSARAPEGRSPRQGFYR